MEFSDEFLVNVKVWKLHDEGNPVAALDPVLRARPYPKDEVIRVVEIALLCTQSAASVRPSMSRVVSMLAGDSEVETTNIMKPCDMHMFSSRNYTTSSSNDAENTANFAAYPSGDGKFMSSNNDHSNISIVNPRWLKGQNWTVFGSLGILSHAKKIQQKGEKNVIRVRLAGDLEVEKTSIMKQCV